MIKSLLGIQSDFQHLFFDKEYHALQYKNGNSIVILVLILFFTFIALGYAIGGLDNLAQKMDDPFTNWVDIEVKKDDQKKLSEISERFESIELKKQFAINDVDFHNRFSLGFYGNQYDYFNSEIGDFLFNKTGFTLNSENPLWERILSQKEGNFVAGKTFEELSENPELFACGIIMKKEAMDDLGYMDYNSQLRIPLRVGEDLLFVEVLAVVKDIPKLCSFISSPRLYNILVSGTKKGIECSSSIISNSPTKNTYKFLLEKADETQYEATIKDAFPTKNVDSEIEELNLSTKDKLPILNLYFDAFDLPKKETIDSLLKHNNWTPYAFVQCADLCNELAVPDYMAFNFKELGLIRSFGNYMKKEFDIEISMNQVEEKENFALVSKLTLIVSIILLLFGLTSILLFINNLLRAHLNEVKENLGTFKAFGLGNDFLVQNYLKIIFSFLLIATIGAFFAALIFEQIEKALSIESIFNILNFRVLAVILLIFIISLFGAKKVISKILNNSPGDLIYGR